MAQEKTKVVEGKIDQLIPDDKNMNRHNQYGMSLLEKSIGSLGLGRSILVDKNNKIIAGNGVTETAANLGMEDVIIVPTDGKKLVVVRRDDIDLDSKEGRELALADNAVANVNLEWDTENIQEVTERWGINAEDWGIKAEEELDLEALRDNPYSDKIKAPIYEPTGEKPPIGELYNIDKTNSLIEEINNADISDEDKRMLIVAAQRHIVFDYRNIANYYAQSSKEVQELMEKSALVIIDFSKAIENGYVKLTKEIEEQFRNDYGLTY